MDSDIELDVASSPVKNPVTLEDLQNVATSPLKNLHQSSPPSSAMKEPHWEVLETDSSFSLSPSSSPFRIEGPSHSGKFYCQVSL